MLSNSGLSSNGKIKQGLDFPYIKVNKHSCLFYFISYCAVWKPHNGAASNLKEVDIIKNVEIKSQSALLTMGQKYLLPLLIRMEVSPVVISFGPFPLVHRACAHLAGEHHGAHQSCGHHHLHCQEEVHHAGDGHQSHGASLWTNEVQATGRRHFSSFFSIVHSGRQTLELTYRSQCPSNKRAGEHFYIGFVTSKTSSLIYQTLAGN